MKILTTKREYRASTFILDGTPILLVKSPKYQGVEISRKLGFKAYLVAVAAKATATSVTLSRLLLNVEGSGQRKRQLLSTVVYSQLLYTAPICSGALAFEINVQNLLRPQRTMALRIAKAYRTVSNEAALVVAELIPVHHLTRERVNKHKARAH